MAKTGKLTLALTGLLLCALLFYPLVSRWLQQPRQREIQTNFLNRNYSYKLLPNKKLLLLAKNQRSAMKLYNADASRSNLNFSRPLSLSSQFETVDHHWSATYTITKISASYIEIYIEANGESPALARSSNGFIKLQPKKWPQKNAPCNRMSVTLPN